MENSGYGTELTHKKCDLANSGLREGHTYIYIDIYADDLMNSTK